MQLNIKSSDHPHLEDYFYILHDFITDWLTSSCLYHILLTRALTFLFIGHYQKILNSS